MCQAFRFSRIICGPDHGYDLVKSKRSPFQSLYADGERGYTYGDLVLLIAATEHANNWLR
jgi:hypothetical protein